MRSLLTLLRSALLPAFALGVACSASSPGEPAAGTSPSPTLVSSEVSPPDGPVALPTASAVPSAPPPSASSAPTAAPSSVPFPTGFKILVIGDSFAEALGVGLKAREKDHGMKVVLQGAKATFIPEWAGPNRNVPGLVKQFAPNLVVISLGGNELAMVDPSVRAPKVAALIEHVKSVPCVWVAPPLWGNKDNGLLEIIRKHSGPCRYFDSNVLSPGLPRGGDKIHPTAEGQKQWADNLLGWLKTERDVSVTSFALRPRPAAE